MHVAETTERRRSGRDGRSVARETCIVSRCVLLRCVLPGSRSSRSSRSLGDATQPAVADRARALHQHSLARSHIRFDRLSLDFSIISEPV
ncbi:hypothetical protein ALC57_14837 [Trachymyrmex cornetzi]|uniref:Uncharacterized protein n=1 Tax=Trachymyrmex cornetzi TaxID=471704 RepID=A0A151IXT3_9HYME|nr:hypothetical protein ALC57_14837 [Trachymyrmex cornetzi]